jgi:cytosol alanyl aminopeptidase
MARGKNEPTASALLAVWWGGAVLQLATLACGANPSAPALAGAASARAAEQQAPKPTSSQTDVRLSAALRPTRYELDLRVDPNAERFAGRVRIHVQIIAPLRNIELNAEALVVRSAKVTSAGSVQAADVKTVSAGRIALGVSHAIDGAATLELEYDGALGTDPRGLYRVTATPSAVYSLLEPLGARRVFPCFDEPGYKTPFDVTLRVPHADVALSNAPVVSTTIDGELDVVRFGTTRPLPTYLLAFAVGPFDLLDAPIGNLPHRLVTPRGERELARYAAGQTPRILDALTRYFGSPYPYEKLDQIAVPGFPALAVENAGLVTYLDSALLLDDEASAEARTQLRSTMAHELSHQWFGNQVTMRWWDDLWLNEAFATWMGEKVMAEVAPELDSPLWAVTSMLSVMSQDSRRGARAVQKKIESDVDIEGGFDAITYKKGFAVLRMLEGWLGADVFRAGVRDYIARHAWGNASLADLERALERSSGKPVGAVLRPFVQQPGVPLLTFEMSCAGDRVTLRHAQRRYWPAPERANGKEAWPVPACFHLFGADREEVACAVLDPAASEQVLPAHFCPEFVYPNAGELGYYHYQIPPSRWVDLATQHRSRLALSERIGLPSHAAAAFVASALDARAFVDVLRGSAREPHRFVLEGVLAGLVEIRKSWPLATDMAPLERFADELLSPQLRRVGVRSRPGEPTDHELVRRGLVQTAFSLRADAATSRAARDVSEQFLADPIAVPAGDVETLLPIAASHGDERLQTRLLKLLADGRASARRAAIVNALGSFDDPALLVRTYELWLQGTLQPLDFWPLRNAAMYDPRRYDVLWRWYLSHADAVIARLGSRARGLPWLSALQCTAEGQAEARAHFADASRFGEGSHDSLDAALEVAERCSKQREQHGPSLVDALSLAKSDSATRAAPSSRVD